MHNLTVAHDHTYAVGDGQAVVHSVGPGYCDGIVTFDLNRNNFTDAEQAAINDFTKRSTQAVVRHYEETGEMYYITRRPTIS